jgi:hypothetical protein
MEGPAIRAELFERMTCTDSVAEIHNALTKPREIVLTRCYVHGAQGGAFNG